MNTYMFEFELRSINGEPVNENNIKPFFKALSDASQGSAEEPDLYPKMISMSGHPPVTILMKIKGK